MRRKSIKYEIAKELDRIIQSPKPFYENSKGRWKQEFFKNNHDLVLELGCGRGEYSIGLGRVFSEKNFLGIDIKGDRLAAGGMAAEREGLKNIAFLRIPISKIENFFEENEVDEIWITFPDPRPKDRDEKKRLTNAFFLGLYKKILKKGGKLHLKTDSDSLFDYSLEVLREDKDWEIMKQTRDLYQSEYLNEHHGIKTRFEGIFTAQGYSIKYLQLKLI